MKGTKTAQLTSDLLAKKGAAAPANKDRESLGPEQVARIVANAAGQPIPETAAEQEPQPLEPVEETKPKRGGRVNLSVRLDPDRHRRLKLASIHLGETAQNIIILALDAYMDQIANDLLAISRGFIDSGESDDAIEQDETSAPAAVGQAGYSGR